jgi:hypothetical protein
MIDGQSVSLSWCRALIWSSWPHFCFLFDNWGFLDVGHPVWRKDGSVIYSYNWFWAWPEQSFSGPSWAELTTIFYCPIWYSPSLKGQVRYPPGTGSPSYSLGHWDPLLLPPTSRIPLHNSYLDAERFGRVLATAPQSNVFAATWRTQRCSGTFIVKVTIQVASGYRISFSSEDAESSIPWSMFQHVPRNLPAQSQ